MLIKSFGPALLYRRNELQALDLAITAFMSSLAFISMIGKDYQPGINKSSAVGQK